MQLALHAQFADAELPVVEGRWYARLDEIDEVGVGRLEIVDDGPDLMAFGVAQRLVHLDIESRLRAIAEAEGLDPDESVRTAEQIINGLDA